MEGGTYKNTGSSHLNVFVEQLVACNLSEISLQLEFQRLTKEMTLQNTKGNDTGTEILTNSSRSGGSIDSVRVRQWNQLEMRWKVCRTDLGQNIYKAK